MISLQKLCLSVIVEKFEEFYLAFKDTNNELPKRSFEFLQRKYSSEITSELFKREMLKEEYLEFLINKHLKFFDERWLHKYRCENCIKDIFCRLTNLIVVCCYKMTDEILENIAKYCPQIVEINAVISSVTDEGLKYLYKNEKGKLPCLQVKKLEISLHGITDEVIKCLILKLPFLEEIQYANVPRVLHLLHKDDLPNLEAVRSYNITHLSFSEISSLPYYTDILKICLKVCPRLKSMSCDIKEKEQLDLFNNTCLEDLELFIIEMNPRIDISNFLKINGRNLLSLKIFNGMISINVLTVSCLKLRRLSLENCTFYSDFDEQKSDLDYLIECTFSDIRFDIIFNEAMSLFLSCSPKLEELDLDFCDFTSKMETHNIIWSHCNLKSVSLYKCHIEMEILKDILSDCSLLNTLSLMYCTGYDYNGDDIKILIEFAAELYNQPNIVAEY